MKIHHKIKNLRENKKLSQDYLAYELGLNQSQYSRRESGEIPFSAIEIEKAAKALDTKISELYDEETTVFNNLNQKGGNFGQYQTITISEKLIEQYEKRIEEMETIISLLKEQIEMLKKK